MRGRFFFAEFSNYLLAEVYRGELATLSKQVAKLHKLLGHPCTLTFSLSSNPVAARRSGLVGMSPRCRLSTTDWLRLCRDPSPKGSLPPLENGVSRMYLDDLVDVPILNPTNQPWRYVTCRGSRKQQPLAMGASLVKVSPDWKQTRNSFAALDPETSATSSLGASKVPGGTCAFALCSGSLTDGFYLWFRSSKLPHSTDSRTGW